MLFQQPNLWILYKIIIRFSTITKNKVLNQCVGSTTWILRRHSALSITNILGILFTNRSRSISSPSIRLGPPLPLLIGFQVVWFNILTGASIGLLWTCSNYLKQFSTIFSIIWVTPTHSHIRPFQIISFLIWPHIHLNILISATHILMLSLHISTFITK